MREVLTLESMGLGLGDPRRRVPAPDASQLDRCRATGAPLTAGGIRARAGADRAA